MTPATPGQDGFTPGRDGVGLLAVPVNKTSPAFTKTADRIVGEQVAAREKLRPQQPAVVDLKTAQPPHRVRARPRSWKRRPISNGCSRRSPSPTRSGRPSRREGGLRPDAGPARRRARARRPGIAPDHRADGPVAGHPPDVVCSWRWGGAKPSASTRNVIRALPRPRDQDRRYAPPRSRLMVRGFGDLGGGGGAFRFRRLGGLGRRGGVG